MISTDTKTAIVEKMQQANLSAELQAAFLRAATLAQGGDDGTIAESAITPAEDIPDIDVLGNYSRDGTSALGQTAMIKLNGGLGTSMGLAQAKSLLPVKNGLCFLEVIAKQVMRLRETNQATFPLIFMNSFRTEADTLAKLDAMEDLATGQGDMPFSFLQNKVPKLAAADFTPVTHADDPTLEWCPPGHGDIYIALKQSGLLDRLLERDFRYVFVSNADNLGASLDVNLLGYFANTNAPFLMEVAARTAADKKGGHIAINASNQRLLLREIAQTAEADLAQFQDIQRHRYFNTNSIWLNLIALDKVLRDHDGIIPLPIIINRKTVDPTNKNSTPVVQLESAMGAAIETFADSRAVRVHRNRFLPVKKTNDLLLLMSDLYEIDSAGVIKRTTDGPLPTIELDEHYFGNIRQFLDRIGSHPPSLARCASLKIEGDIRLGKEVSLIGHVRLSADPGQSLKIDDNAVIRGS
ncbi:MAG: UTP--glucose-1-phosphate uridylyltransferase [Gammaproteobacteria bacterium]